MPNINLHPTTKHRALTGRFLQIKSRQALKNQLDLERATIRSTSSSSISFSSTPHLNRSALITGLFATMALSAMVVPCAHGAPVQEKPNREPDPLLPAAIKGGHPIRNTPQSSCLVGVVAKYSCTGSVVAPNVVLTAQHCVIESNTGSLGNLLNVPDTHHIRVHKIDGNWLKVPILGKGGHEVEAAYLADGFWVNDQYTYNTPKQLAENNRWRAHQNDLAVLTLRTPINCTQYYQLPTEAIIEESSQLCIGRGGSGGNFTIRGYGSVNFGDNIFSAREADVQCKKWFGDSETGAYRVSNAENVKSGGGDSGSPLVFKKQDKEYQVGVCRGNAEDGIMYSSLKSRINNIKEIIKHGDTAKMLKMGCIKLYSHFSFVWESSQRITLTNTCKQPEHVVLAMGVSNKGGDMISDFTNDENQKNKIVLTPGQSLSFAIHKNKRPVFPFSRTPTVQKLS